MKAKQKAEELYKMYNNLIIEDVINMKPIYFIMTHKMAKKSALIAVDEILNKDTFLINITANDILYWREVKQEIEKL